jgi:hypothetical protein
MTSPEIARAIVPKPNEGLHDILEFILSQYVAATAQRFKDNELRSAFRTFQKTVADLPFVAGKFQTASGIGQGKWADVPWLAILDPRETTTVQKGVYCILLLRKDWMLGFARGLESSARSPVVVFHPIWYKTFNDCGMRAWEYLSERRF